MLKLSSFTSFCIAFLTALLLTTQAIAAPAPGNIAIGEVVPSYLGIDIETNKIDATQYAGKVLVVTFWASWCGPCVNELQVLENLQNLAKKSVQVVAINIEDRDKFRKLHRTLKNLTLKLSHDYGNSVADKFGVKGIPHMLIIGRDGKVINVHRGYGDGMIPRLVAEINAAIAQKAPEPSAAVETKTEPGQ